MLSIPTEVSPSKSAAPVPPDADDPRCGKCGYCVRGVPSFTCPECGSDLRAVGIVTATTHPRLTTAKLAIAWSVAVIVCAATLSKPLTAVLPTLHVTHQHRVIFSQFPPLQATIEADCERRWVRWGAWYGSASVPLDEVMIRASDHPASPPLWVNWKSKAYHYSDNGQTVRRSNGFGPDALLAWLNAAGVRAEDPNGMLKTWHGPPIEQATAERLQQVIDDIDAIPVSQMRFSPHDLAPGGTQAMIAHPSFVYTTIAPWTNLGLALLWVFVWLVGLWRILRRRRDRSAAAPVT